MQVNQTFSNKACCLQHLLITSSILIFTWQKLHSSPANQISETIFHFLPNPWSPDTTTKLHFHISSTVKSQNQFLCFSWHLWNFFFHTRFPKSTPSNNTSLWCAERSMNCWNLDGDAWKATTHLGNHSWLSCFCFNTNPKKQIKPHKVFLCFWLFDYIFVFCFFFF